jgi:hypothetical protein
MGPGKTLLLALFGCGIWIFLRDFALWAVLLASVSIATFWPALRNVLLAAAPMLLVVIKNLRDPLRLGMTLGIIVSGILLYWCANRWPRSYFGQRPVAHLLVGFSAIIFLASVTPVDTTLNKAAWNVVGILANYVWFIAYAFLDRNSKPADDFTLQLATFRPIWGSTNTPFPKGAAYLRRIEARTPEQLAVAQLKGMKLLIWAILLGLLQVLWNRFFHGYLRIPLASEALAMSVSRTPVAWHLRWESQILFFFEQIFAVSIFGGWVIGSCRMAGFNALRNTYRPLTSTTIADFFNRFYYYYKELLVDIFFYPAFLRYWKKHRRIRMAFATFSAVLFGNTFYHFTRDWQIIRDAGLWQAMVSYEASLFYCFLLSAGLTISQLRKRTPRSPSVFRRHLLPVFGVIAFYCLINVFVISERSYPLTSYLMYLKSLFIPNV